MMEKPTVSKEDLEYVPFAPGPKNKSPQQVQEARVTIHGALRRSALALMLLALLCACGFSYVRRLAPEIASDGISTHSLGTKLSSTAMASLFTGATLFALLATALAATYPQPVGFPPHSAIKRLQVARMLMLLFGVGYVIRGIDLLKRSRWLVEFGSNTRKDGSLSEDTVISVTAWSGGAANAAACAVVGTVGVLLSYFVAQQLKSLRLAMRLTKSVKTR